MSFHLSDSGRGPTFEVMTNVNMLRRTRSHRHHAVTTHVIRQRAGVPYEVEQQVCSECRTVLSERQLRRAAA
jgi:hypothetical protein